MKNKVLSSLIILLSIVLIAFLYWVWRGNFLVQKVREKPYNVLIISACSLNPRFLSAYGYNKFRNTPNLEKLADKSVVFYNAFSDVSWSNVTGHIASISKEELAKKGYEAIGLPFNKEEREWHRFTKNENPSNYYFRIPRGHKILGGRSARITNKALLEVKDRIIGHKGRPFLLEVHLKMSHAPYAGGGESQNVNFFDQAPAWMATHGENSIQNPEKAPMIILTTPRTRLQANRNILSANQTIKNSKAFQLVKNNSAATLMGMISSPEIIELWRRNPDYEKDLEYIKYSYARRLQILDEFLGEILNLYGEKEILENTVVIFTGDHGEAFMEHGRLTHGDAVYDEVLNYPMMVHIPGMKKRFNYVPQFYQGSILKLVRGIMNKEIDSGSLLDFLKANEKENEVIFSRDCNLSLRSVRYQNKWKYIEDSRTGERELYDLRNDPGETKNVVKKYPDIAADLEAKLLDYNGKGNRMMHACVPGGE